MSEKITGLFVVLVVTLFSAGLVRTLPAYTLSLPTKAVAMCVMSATSPASSACALIARDLDCDRDADVVNILEVASRWRSSVGEPNYGRPHDCDGDIDIVDIMKTAARWGESCESASYTCDAMGNRLSITTPEGTITYTYDAADRLLSTSDGTTFIWDDNGNMLSKGSTVYTYNAANRLIQVVSGTTMVQFIYDGDGKLIRRIANGTTTDYLHVTLAGIPQVLVESSGGNDTFYTYGLARLAMITPEGTQSYYHFDGLNSVVNLTNHAGQVTASYVYDAFGMIRSQTRDAANLFTFAGEQTDPSVNLHYLRTRWYDPALGRFLTRDPFAGYEEDILSLNRYVYVRNNPINFVDPSGQDWASESWAFLKDVGRAVVDFPSNLHFIKEWDSVKPYVLEEIYVAAGRALQAIDITQGLKEAQEFFAEEAQIAAKQGKRGEAYLYRGLRFAAGVDRIVLEVNPVTGAPLWARKNTARFVQVETGLFTGQENIYDATKFAGELLIDLLLDKAVNKTADELLKQLYKANPELATRIAESFGGGPGFRYRGGRAGKVPQFRL